MIVNLNTFALPVDGIFFNGGTQETPGANPIFGDVLTINGDASHTATYLPDGVASALDNDGSVVITGAGVGTINFTQLEPVDFIGLGTVNLNYANGADVISIANGFDAGTGLLDAVVVSGTSGGVAFEQAHLRNIGTVNLNTSTTDGNDSITISSASNSHGITDFNIVTGAGADTVTVNGNATFTGDVNIASQNIAFNGGTLSAGTTKSVTLNAGLGAISTNGPGRRCVAQDLFATATTGIDLDTTVVTITASNTGAGNIVIDETDAVTLTSLTAANGNISISNATADMTVVTVTASGSVNLTATAGNIVDDGSNATRVSAGTSATFTANAGAIGVAGAMSQIDTAAASITATSANGIWIGELDTVAITNATTTNGIIEIVSGGTMTATNVVAGGASDLRLTTTAGDIVVSVVDAAGDSVLLQAAGAITDGNGSANNITATNLNAVAGTGIGTAGNAIETSITNLAASGGTGGVFVTNTGDLTITNLTTFTVPTSGVTATGDITIATTGNLTVSKAVTSSGAVTLSFGQANAGNTATVNATIDGTSATILGGTGDDSITVNTTGTTDLLLNGQDGSDDYIVNFGTLGAGDVVIADSGVATDIDQAFLTGTTSADTFEVNTTVSGTNAVTRGSERVTYLASNLEEMQISAGDGADIFNVQFAASKLPGVFRILGEADSDTANLYGTTAADTFTVTHIDTVSFGSTGEVVRYDDNLEKLNVNGPSFAGDPTPTAPTLTDAGDTFIVTPDVQTAITIRGGNPVNGFGDTLNLNVLGATTGINLSNAKVPTGSITWGAAQRATVDWTSIETFPIPLGLGGSFDFNSGTSPTQQGFYGVLSSDTPSSGSLAYAQVGWTTPTFSFDRPTDAPASGPLGDLLRDGAYNWWTPTNARTFQVKVANGQPVQITAVIGDTYTGRDFIRMEVSSDGGVTWVSLPGSTNDTFTMRNLGYDFVSFTSTLYTPSTETLLVRIYDDATNGGDTFWVLNSLEVRPQEMVFPLTFARPNVNTLTDMLIADGTTIDTYTGTGAAPNAVLTVTVSNGANAGIDVLPQMKEFQIQADALGAYSFQVLRPTGTANTISLRDVTGNSFGTINVTYVLPTVRRVDFGTATSPVQVLTPAQIESTTTPKYVGFGAQAYTGTNGNAMGWVNSPGLNTFDRSSIAATTGDLLRDGVYGNQANAGVFRMDLAAAVGTSYTITVTLGDLFQARDQMFVDVVDAGGALISTVVSNALTPLNQATSFTFTAMTDATGSIFLRFRDAGGDQVWGLSSIEARPTVGTFTITPNSGTVPADGTTMTTYTITGATANTLITLSTTQGVITTSDGNVTYTSLQVLTDNAGNATFTIVSPQSSNAITGTIVASEVTGAKSASITQAYTAAASNQPAVAKYDFNGGSIDTALNRTSVRGNTVFSTSLGYGWLSSVYEFERTAASTPIDPSLYRDGAWGYGFSGTFRATVAPSSSSTVRVYVGDSYGNWGGIVVSAEGGATANPNTTAAPFGFVDVIGTDTNNDGFLDITIGNLPGYSVWVVNGIDITPNSSNLPTPPALTVMGPGAPTAAGSTSTFSITGATPNSLVTVTASKGTLIGTDASSSIAGFQVMTDFSGTASVHGAGSAVVRCGDGHDFRERCHQWRDRPDDAELHRRDRAALRLQRQQCEHRSGLRLGTGQRSVQHDDRLRLGERHLRV